jgi:acetyl-CoA C-acetyltransferase
LAETDATVLARAVVDELVQRTGLAPKDFDDLVLAESLYGEGVVARYVALEAGLENVAGLALNRHCAAGLAAVETGSASIMAGMDNVIIVGGLQASSMSPVEKERIVGTPDWVDWTSPSHPEPPHATCR